MRLNSRVSACARIATAIAIAASLFASGPVVSASGQNPTTPQQAQPAPKPPPGTPPTSIMQLTADEAVRLALENNLGIQTEKLNPQLQALAVSRSLAAYTPEIFGATARNSDSSPPTDFLSQGVAVTTTGNITGSSGVRQNVPWLGGFYSIGLSGLRFTSNAPRTPFSPQLGSNLSFQATQPLLRGLRIDSLRQAVLQNRNALAIADVQLAQRITITSRNVRFAYYSLVLAISSANVAQGSLDLARQSYKNNQRRVEVGTMAPIDIVEAEAEVARQEENVIVRQAVIQSAEDNLRTLILNPSSPDFWTTKLEPSEQPVLTERPVDLDAAIKRALANRTDLLILRKQIESVDLDIKFNRDQKLPAVNLQATYGTRGVGGTKREFADNGIDILSTSTRPFNDVLHDVFANSYRNWSFQINVSYPIGTSQADAALAASKLQREQGTVGLRQVEVAITAQVREAVRDITTTLQRVQATRKARDLMERRLEAENKRLSVGIGNTFQVIQAQRDLDNAKQSELNAIIDYNRALIDLEAIQTVPLGGGGF
jgi:outer membrane protein TolC